MSTHDAINDLRRNIEEARKLGLDVSPLCCTLSRLEDSLRRLDRVCLDDTYVPSPEELSRVQVPGLDAQMFIATPTHVIPEMDALVEQSAERYRKRLIGEA